MFTTMKKLNKNIFLISREEIQNRLKNNNFLDSYNIIKILPSKLLVKFDRKKCFKEIRSKFKI